MTPFDALPWNPCNEVASAHASVGNDTISTPFNLYGDGGELFNGLASIMIDHIVPVERCP